jgi:hypothetical protein
MSDQVSSQPPDHEPEAQPAADEPHHPAVDSKAEAGEPEPETQKRRWWGFWHRQRGQRGRPGSRFSVLTALISAAAALIGAIVGEVASYVAAQSQADAQFHVAQTNNTAQANQALITRRQIAYSDFMAAQEDLVDAAFRFGDAINDFRPPNIDPVKAAFKQWDDVHNKWAHEVDTVELVDSPEVQHGLEAILTNQDDMRITIGGLAYPAIYQMTTADPDRFLLFSKQVVDLKRLGSAFLAPAKRDISGQS